MVKNIILEEKYYIEQLIIIQEGFDIFRIIGERASGKTSQLMLIAKEKGANYACMNPYAMREKASAYGLTGINFISFSDLFTGEYMDQPVVIDELELFVKYYTDCKLIGYTLTKGD